MIPIIFRVTFPLSVMVAFLALGLVSPTKAAPEKPRSSEAPMTFYVAKGGPSACGLGCSEWIAAEGTFGLGSATRFRALLGRLGKEKLPVFFDSPGGLVGEALAIGRLLREKGLTSGIGRTNVESCADEKKAKECSELKKSNKKLDADLQAHNARCNSACVYAVLGGKTRVVWPGTRLGVHAARSVSIQDGRVKAVDLAKVTPQRQKASQQRFKEKLRGYVREMGIDGRLVEIAEAVPHEKVHYLTRDQIADLGIDRSEFRETPWKFTDNTFTTPAVAKFFLEAKGGDRKEFPASHIRISCAGRNNVTLLYSRGLISGDTTKLQVKLSVGGDGIPVSTGGVYQYDWIENQRLFEVRRGSADFALLLSGDALEIAETSWSAPAPYVHIVRLSTLGLTEALGKLREKCANRL